MKLHYKTLGTGECIIILHGLYGSSDNWHSIAKSLSANYSVILPDLRNHGNSPHNNIFTLAAMKNDLKELFDELEIEKAILIGHSLGGKVALDFASEFSVLLSKLIIVDIAPRKYTDIEFVEKSNHLNIINILKNINLQKYKNRDDALNELQKIDLTGRLKFFMMKNIKRENNGNLTWKININAIADNLSTILNVFDADLTKITCPTLFIRGEKSEYLTNDDFLTISKDFKKVKLKTIKDATHWLHNEKPEEFIKIVTDYIIS